MPLLSWFKVSITFQVCRLQKYVIAQSSTLTTTTTQPFRRRIWRRIVDDVDNETKNIRGNNSDANSLQIDLKDLLERHSGKNLSGLKTAGSKGMIFLSVWALPCWSLGSISNSNLSLAFWSLWAQTEMDTCHCGGQYRIKLTTRIVRVIELHD